MVQKRRMWDSNPRYLAVSLVFKTSPISHSGNSPNNEDDYTLLFLFCQALFCSFFKKFLPLPFYVFSLHKTTIFASLLAHIKTNLPSTIPQKEINFRPLLAHIKTNLPSTIPQKEINVRPLLAHFKTNLPSTIPQKENENPQSLCSRDF